MFYPILCKYNSKNISFRFEIMGKKLKTLTVKHLLITNLLFLVSNTICTNYGSSKSLMPETHSYCMGVTKKFVIGSRMLKV